LTRPRPEAGATAPALLLAAALASCGLKRAQAPAPSADPYGEAGPEAAESYADPAAWKLAWSDEFDGPSLDESKWTRAEGAHGWGNVELQAYTLSEKNARTEGGALVIEALRDSAARNGYTSARLHTKGKFSFTYGKVEARIKIPQAPHVWPCFWMLGDLNGKPWPNCGEIDIAEAAGNEPRTLGGAIHGTGFSGGRAIVGKKTLPYSLSKTWRVVGIEWEEDEIRWYLDGELFHKANKADLPQTAVWAFDHPFYFILNLAVGGNLADFPRASSAFPQTMLVDYVRVYRKTGT